MIQKRIEKEQDLKKGINNSFFFTFSAFCLFFLTACSNEGKETLSLPYIGHHDIVEAPFDDYKIGDTIYHTTPYWSYITEDSMSLTSEDIDDKLWIVDFFYATCPTICSPMTDIMKSIADSLASFSDDIVFLSFTIDSDNDTPEVLRTYRKRHGITADNWYFLTGVDSEETNRMAFDGFTIFAKEDKTEPGGFAHSSNFVLVDTNEHIRGVYNSFNDEDLVQLIADVKRLLAK